jgi:hypothetical protein
VTVLRVITVDGSPAAVNSLVAALREALAGGPAVLPVPPGAAGVRDEPGEGAAVVIATSGSTGAAKHVVLSAAALQASARATADRLGGPARWLLALPAHHVAGVQVVGRAPRAGGPPGGGGRASLIVTDGVFSMDGDIAPLADLSELARMHRCRLMVDEAHATGAVGPGGRGSVAAAGIGDGVDVIVGTLGKALGSYGAYVCADAEVRELLINLARPFIFSTAPPPPAIAAAYAALSQLEGRSERLARLRENARALRSALSAQGFGITEDGTQIIPLLVGEAGEASALCEAALRRGVFAQAIRPPTVREGSARLRLTVMATHREGELRRAAAALGEAFREVSGARRPLATAA